MSDAVGIVFEILTAADLFLPQDLAYTGNPALEMAAVGAEG